MYSIHLRLIRLVIVVCIVFIVTLYILRKFDGNDIPVFPNIFQTSLPTVQKNTFGMLNDSQKVEYFKNNWKGNCSYPTFIPEVAQAQSWFPIYMSHLQNVSLKTLL